MAANLIGGLVGLAGAGVGALGAGLHGRRAPRRQMKRLQAEVSELEQQLQRARDSDGQSARIEELARDADAIKAAMEDLKVRNQDLEAANDALHDEAEQAAVTNARLAQAGAGFESQVRLLGQEKAEMASKLEEMRITHAAELTQYQDQLDKLRAQVSETMSKLLSKDISDKDAVAAMERMGCTVSYIEAAPASSDAASEAAAEREGQPPRVAAVEWEQPQLLLDDLGRLERLVAASHRMALPSSKGSAPMRRLPVVAFPVLKGPSGMPRFNMPTAGLAGLEAQQRAHAALADAGGGAGEPPDAPRGPRGDQAQSKKALGGKAALRAGKAEAKKGRAGVDQAEAKPGVKFTYSLQGAKGNQWIAKVPRNQGLEEQASGIAYLSSDNSPKLLGHAGGARAGGGPSSHLLACLGDDDMGGAPTTRTLASALC